jgi:hypothetical protein
MDRRTIFGEPIIIRRHRRRFLVAGFRHRFDPLRSASIRSSPSKQVSAVRELKIEGSEREETFGPGRA